ncbi:TPA: hypothetical protein OGO64_002829 [Escherichia coli]|nr:hypothetical protein [Escherichia coli]
MAPIIKIGEFAMSGNNVFDGLFASPERDLDARFQEVYAFLHNELDTADVEEIAERVMWDNNSDIEDFAARLGSDISGAYSWELQRLRGRVTAYLGFDAIEMNDEHGTSYLIVNPQIKGE